MEGTLRGRIMKSIAATIKELLPEGLGREVRQYRAHNRDERRLYLKIRMSNWLGLRKPKLSRVPNTTRSVLFVCFGNIIRSPMCEALLKKELARFHDSQFTVMSAGLNSIPGRPAHPWAITAAKEFDISLEDHRAQLLTQE